MRTEVIEVGLVEDMEGVVEILPLALPPSPPPSPPNVVPASQDEHWAAYSAWAIMMWVVTIQRAWRAYCARSAYQEAWNHWAYSCWAVELQRVWRGYAQRWRMVMWLSRRWEDVALFYDVSLLERAMPWVYVRLRTHVLLHDAPGPDPHAPARRGVAFFDVFAAIMVQRFARGYIVRRILFSTAACIRAECHGLFLGDLGPWFDPVECLWKPFPHLAFFLFRYQSLMRAHAYCFVVSAMTRSWALNPAARIQRAYRAYRVKCGERGLIQFLRVVYARWAVARMHAR